jgi:hypothetical protein
MVYALTGYFRDALGAATSRRSWWPGRRVRLLRLDRAARARPRARGAAEGISTSGIDLWFFGGVASSIRDTASPGEEFRISAAGPAVTLLVVVATAAAAVALSSTDAALDAARFSDTGASTAWRC